MNFALELSEELKTRVSAIAARSNMTAEQIIVDALENGHSLEWQERFLERVAAGLAEAEQGQFASDADIDRVVNKYRPVRCVHNRVFANALPEAVFR